VLVSEMGIGDHRNTQSITSSSSLGSHRKPINID
jgi:hypothetical protein